MRINDFQYDGGLMRERTAENINILGRFCGKRDIEALRADCLKDKYKIEQADLMVLFGGSILCGGDVLAGAMKECAARHYIIVGGAGHTTETLRQTVQKEYPSIWTEDLPEAEIFNRYLKEAYGLEADYLETKSTNCGNNITCLLDLVEEKQLPCRSVILCQDATMQRRMDAGFQKYMSRETLVINYASYKATVIAAGDTLTYSFRIHGMWEIERYVQLLMGEIPRLTDDADGYGPRGKNFIAHVDIPDEVKSAFEELKMVYGEQVRSANPLYATH